MGSSTLIFTQSIEFQTHKAINLVGFKMLLDPVKISVKDPMPVSFVLYIGFFLALRWLPA